MIRALGILLGSMSSSFSQLTWISSPLILPGLFLVHAQSGLAPRPWTAIMLVQCCIRITFQDRATYENQCTQASDFSPAKGSQVPTSHSIVPPFFVLVSGAFEHFAAAFLIDVAIVYMKSRLKLSEDCLGTVPAVSWAICRLAQLDNALVPDGGFFILITIDRLLACMLHRIYTRIFVSSLSLRRVVII